MKLKSIHEADLVEDKDLTLGGSRDYAQRTEGEVLQKHSTSSAGSGVKPPPAGDISKIVDMGPAYATDTLIPSKIHRKGQDPKVQQLKV
jgi:hypothetical protein